MDITEYSKEVSRSLSYTDDDWISGEIPDDLECTFNLTESLLNDGGVAFGNPVFEKEIFSVFHDWFYREKALKVWMYANALLNQLPDDTWSDLKAKLTDYASGNWFEYETVNRSSWPGLPEEYLKNWNWPMHEFSSRFWEEKRRIKETRMDLIFNQKHPDWLNK